MSIKTLPESGRAAYRDARRAEQRQLVEQACRELLSSEGWRRFAETRAAFHRYSTDNPLLVTVAPTLIGAALGFLAAVWLRRGDRDWQTKREASQHDWEEKRERDAHEREVAWQWERDKFAREIQIVRPLDDALVETQRRVQGEQIPEGESRWMVAHREWENGWVRLTPHLADAELEERYGAVGTVLLALNDHVDEGGSGVSQGTLITIAMRAIGNARIALTYWLRGDALPVASFPSRQHVIELLGAGDPDPLAPKSPLRAWLADHPQPPWRPG